MQLVNKVRMEWIIVFMRNRELAFWKKGMFFWQWVSHWSQNFGFCCCVTPTCIIITSMPMVATYRVTVVWIFFFTQNRESVFWKQRMFLGALVRKFWWRCCQNQGRENFVLASCSFKAYCQLHRAFTWIDAKMDIRVSG